MSKKDALRAMGVDHLATAQKYIALAHDANLITIERSKLDARVYLLVPTAKGIGTIEGELDRIHTDHQWAQACLDFDEDRAEELRPDLSFHPAFRDDPVGVPEVIKSSAFGSDAEREIALYSETLEHAPSNVDARLHRAMLLENAGQYHKAIDDLEYLRTYGQGDGSGVLLRLAKCNLKIGELEIALEQVNAAIKTMTLKATEDGDEVWKYARAGGHALRGEVYDLMGQYDLAQREYLEVLEHWPDHPCRNKVVGAGGES